MKYLNFSFEKVKAWPNKNKKKKTDPDFLLTIPVWVNESQSEIKKEVL